MDTNESNTDYEIPYLEDILESLIPKYEGSQETNFSLSSAHISTTSRSSSSEIISFTGNTGGEVSHQRKSSSTCASQISPSNSCPNSPTPSLDTVFLTKEEQNLQILDLHSCQETKKQNNILSPAWDINKPCEKGYHYDPKPLTSKNTRRLVPNEEKNDQYWTRRMRNNKAARKSREYRRQKEMEVLTTMKFLEEENVRLKYFIDNFAKTNQQLQGEVIHLKHQLAAVNFSQPGPM